MIIIYYTMRLVGCSAARSCGDAEGGKEMAWLVYVQLSAHATPFVGSDGV